jgi:hypothetical protein
MDELISKAAEETSETEEELRERWSGSPRLIAEDLFQVRSLDTGEIKPLRLFDPYQPQLLDAYFYDDSKIKNVYKGRRIGVSFIVCLAMAVDGLANRECFFPIVADTQGQANNRIDDIRKLFKHSRLDIPLEKDNQSEIVLPNGSTYEAFSGAPDSSRGDEPAKTVFVDEMAFLEDQHSVMQAFMAFIALGTRGQMFQVSTPDMANDLFLKNHERGTPHGENGIISIKQPTFENPDSIDVTKSLFEQDVTPVRPDLSIEAVETERLQDPKGFGQEYLCNPIAEEYRFFDSDKIEDAIRRSRSPEYVSGPAWKPKHDSKVVLGVDIGISKDDTVVSVWEHTGQLRNLRYLEVITDKKLSKNGINPPKRRNPSSVATRLAQIHDAFDGDYVILDKTGPGEGFQSEVDRAIGRGAHGFNFRDREAVADMMGNFNYGLHKDLITLLPNDRLKNELESVVKKKSKEYQKPKFSGKDHSESGKDDIAMSLVLGAYPPNINTSASKSAHAEGSDRYSDASASVEGASHYTGAKKTSSVSGVGPKEAEDRVGYRKTGKKNYSKRHER